MKNRIITVLAAALLCTSALQAATDYGILIGGVRVTSDNAYNITGNGISTVSDNSEISYNEATNTLTLRGAHVDCLGKYNGINVTASAKHGLRIVLENDNYFYNIMGVAMSIYHPTGATYSSPNVYIQGTGTLDFPKGHGDIVTSNQAYICFGNGVQGGAGQGGCTINADAIYSSKDSDGNRGGYLAVTDACINLKGFSYGTVYGFTWVYNNGTDLAYLPEGAWYNNSNSDDRYLADSDGKKITGEARLGWKRYGVTVGGVDVHAKNYRNVKGAAISGTVSYNPSTKMLDLKDATIDIRKRICWTECLVNYGGELKVSVSGACTLTRGTTNQGQNRTPTISGSRDIKFVGGGTLTIENYEGSGIKMTGGAALSFDGPTSVQIAQGSNSAEVGIDMGGGTLTVKNCDFTSSKGFNNLGDFVNQGTELTDGLVWDPDLKIIRRYYDNTRHFNRTQLKRATENYSVYIAGHELNNVNATTGFHYHNTQGELKAKVDGQTLRICPTNFVADGLDKLNCMQVRTDCPYAYVSIEQKEGSTFELKNPSGVSLYTYKDLNIQGGTVNIGGSLYTYNGVMLTANQTTINGDDISAGNKGGVFKVYGSVVNLSGESYGYPTIRGFDAIDTDAVFMESDMKTPAKGMAYDSENKELRKDGKTYCGEVHMMTPRNLGLAVNNEQVTTLNAGDISFGEQTSGQLYFDEETATLTLRDVVASYVEITDSSERDTLFIRLEGQTRVNGLFNVVSDKGRSLPLAMVIVKGDGPSRQSSLACDRVFCSSDLRLADCQVQARRLLYQFYGNSSWENKRHSLTVDNSLVSLSGNADPTVYTLGGFNSFELVDVEVVEPENWAYGSGRVGNVSVPCLYDGTGYCNIKVEIRPTNMSPAGDVNGDKVVDVADIATVISFMAGTSSASLDAADVNGDHVVDVADIATIISIMAGTRM